ncbi:hypothetical protein [Lysobacter sp. FW306-1B-D06B]|uniref:hypothetical protein n=1 Tax=Lysobacter sp. FW306-1B-D06B TaxID=3140250 RepID=UPI0031409363
MKHEGDLDLEQAARLLGDAGLVPLVVETFAEAAQRLLPQLRQSILANEEGEVRRHLHRLTPTLALLARRDMQDHCERVSAMWHAPVSPEREPHSLALVDRIQSLLREAAQSSAEGTDGAA